MRRWLTLGAVCVLLLATACRIVVPASQKVHPPVGQGAAWQQVDLPGMAQSTRKAVYDATRDSLWIVSLVPAKADPYSQVATLTRVGTTTGSVTQTGLELNARQFYQSVVALDPGGELWMAWDRTLVRYDPGTGLVDTFALPPFAQLGLHPSLWSGDGNFDAIAIDSDGEVWTLADHVAAIFGFNPAIGRWDRVISLRWQPWQIAPLRPGVLAITGARSPDGKLIVSKFAEFDEATGTMLGERNIDVREYAVVDDHTVLFVNSAGDFARLDTDSGHVTVLDRYPPEDSLVSMFAVGAAGEAWFAMNSGVGLSTGIGKINANSGLVANYLYPPIVPTKEVPNQCVAPHGWGTCQLPCPSGVESCVPQPYIPAAEVDALAVDRSGNVWVVTNLAANDQTPFRTDVCGCSVLSPVLELKATAA